MFSGCLDRLTWPRGRWLRLAAVVVLLWAGWATAALVEYQLAHDPSWAAADDRTDPAVSKRDGVEAIAAGKQSSRRSTEKPSLGAAADGLTANARPELPQGLAVAPCGGDPSALTRIDYLHPDPTGPPGEHTS